MLAFFEVISIILLLIKILFKGFVIFVKFLGFVPELLSNVVRASEDTFEIDPLLLYQEPLLNCFRDFSQGLLPVPHAFQESGHILATGYLLQIGQLILKQLFHLIIGLQHKCLFTTLNHRRKLKIRGFPHLLNI